MDTSNPDNPTLCRAPGLDNPTIRNISIYSSIGIIGLFGNLLTLTVLFKSKRAMATTTNIFITSLSIADILFLCFTVPIQI